MLSRRLERTLHAAIAYALEGKYGYATIEHLLLALIDDEDARPVLEACAVDLGQLRREITQFLDVDLGPLISEKPVDPRPTAGFQRTLQRSVIHVRSSGRKQVTALMS